MAIAIVAYKAVVVVRGRGVSSSGRGWSSPVVTLSLLYPLLISYELVQM